MNTPAKLVAELFDLLDFPVRRLQMLVRVALMVIALTMPVTFRHALVVYADAQAARIQQQVVQPLLNRLTRPQPSPPEHGQSHR
jgi:hypothetical protein